MSDNQDLTDSGIQQESPDVKQPDAANVPDWARDPNQATSMVKDLRQEAKGYRTELASVKQQLDAIQAERNQQTEAELAEQKRWEELAKTRETELATLKEQLQAQQAANQQQAVENAVFAQAAQLGFNKPTEAYALVDKSKITFDGSAIEGVEDALKALAEASPYLLKANQPQGDLGAAFNPSGTGQSDDFSWLGEYNDPGAPPKSPF